MINLKKKKNSPSRPTIIFNDLISEEQKMMSELYDSVDCNNLKFKYVCPTKDVTFYENRDSKELFNAIENNQIKVSELTNKQNSFLKKLNEVKMCKKKLMKKEVICNPNKFCNSRNEVINFF